MGNIIVDGAEFEIEVNSPASGTPAKKKVKLKVSSGSDQKAGGKAAAVADDMESQDPVTISYTSPPYSTIPGQLKWDGKFKDFAESGSVEKAGNSVIVDDTDSGEIEWEVVSPAQLVTLAPTPDSTTKYKGKWTLKKPGQTKTKAKK